MASTSDPSRPSGDPQAEASLARRILAAPHEYSDGAIAWARARVDQFQGTS